MTHLSWIGSCIGKINMSVYQKNEVKEEETIRTLFDVDNQPGTLARVIGLFSEEVIIEIALM